MHYDWKEVGNTLRNIRKAKGLRLEDIADPHISIATISSIERGIDSVKSEKRSYYYQLLEIDESNLPLFIDQERQQQNHLSNQLILIESRIDFGHLNKAKKELSQLEKIHRKNASETFDYLKGKYFFHRANWHKAERYFNQAIETVKGNSDLRSTNIHACSYKELARISFFYYNDLNQALSYVIKGLEEFDPNGERQEIEYFLLIGKVIYLEKLNQTDEALQLVAELWNRIDQITNLDVLLNMYETRATLLNKKGRYKEALHYAIEGYRIAYSNQKYSRAVELLTSWGNICLNAEYYNTAEKCYKMALELEDTVEWKFIIVTTYTQLGLLYQKMERWEEAQTFLMIAVKRGEKVKDNHRYCEALKALGDYYLRMGQYHDAISCYQKGENLTKKHGLDDQRCKILVNLSECWRKLGKENELIETLTQLQLQLREKGGIEG